MSDTPCFEPVITGDGKMQCPACKMVEGGSSRIISHRYDCMFKKLPACNQLPPGVTPKVMPYYNDTVPGSTVSQDTTSCWSHKGVYLGAFQSFRLIGNPRDPDPEYTFENGRVSGLGLAFTRVECDIKTKQKIRKNTTIKELKNSYGWLKNAYNYMPPQEGTTMGGPNYQKGLEQWQRTTSGSSRKRKTRRGMKRRSKSRTFNKVR
jgi:hypothetical protein